MKNTLLLIFFSLFLFLSQAGQATQPPLVAGCVNPITGEYIAICRDLTIRGSEPIDITRCFDPTTHTWSFAKRPPKEMNPTGNPTFTTYDSQGRITKIRTTNPSEQTTYAWAHFTYPDAATIKITTSDSHEITYKNFPKLTEVMRDGKIVEKLTYAPSGPLQKRTFDSGQEHLIDTYRPRWNSVGTDHITLTDKDDFRLGRIKTLNTPQELQFFYYEGSTEVLDGENNKTTYTYDQDHRLLSIKSPSNEEYTTYDPSGRPLHITLYDAAHAPLFSKRFIYDKGDIIIEEDSKRSTFSTGEKKLLTTIEENGRSTHLSYRENTQLITHELTYKGNTLCKRRFFEYDQNNILVLTLTDDGSSPQKDDLTHVTARHITHITPKKDAPFASLPEVIEENYLDLNSNEEILLLKTLLSYDAHGNITEKKIYDATNTHRYTLHFTYDPFGRLLSETNPLGQPATYTYDSRGRLTQKTSFCGQLSTICHLFGARVNKETSFSSPKSDSPFQILYDMAGRKRALITPKGKEEYSYDPLGRLHCTTTERVHIFNTYDLLNRLTEETTTDHQNRTLDKTTFTYDEAGNRSEITRWVADQPSTTTFRYDPFGRLIEEINPEGNINRIEYDETNPPYLTLTHTSPLGHKTITTTDEYNRQILTQKKDAYGKILSIQHFSYNDQGKLIEHTGEGSIHWEYDTRGNLTTLTHEAHTSNPKITRFTYAPDGTLEHTVKPNGIVLTTTYTPEGRIASLISSDDTIHYTYTYDPNGHLIAAHDTVLDRELTRTFDPHGNLIEETLPNGLSIQNTYDAFDRRTTLLLPDKSAIHYTYDAIHLKNITRFSPEGSPLYTHTYIAHDPNGHPLEEEHIASLGTTTRTLNHRGQITQLTSPGLSQSADYDAEGNLTQALIKTPFSGYTANYTYDPLGRLTQETAPLFQTHTYDADNNPLDKDPTNLSDLQLTFDPLDRLTTVTKENHFKIIYTYDALHRRNTRLLYTWKGDTWHHTSTRHFLYDNTLEIGSTDENHTIHELRVLGSTPTAEMGAAVAIELDNTPYCPIHDLFGNTLALINIQTRQLVALYQYTAFGEEKSLFNSPLHSPWRYASKRTDPHTQLVHFGRRDYNPKTNRWLTPDPQGYTDTPNLYVFNKNSPLTYRDPYGLEAFRDSLPNIDTAFSYLGKTIYFLYENFALIPFIREKGMAIGKSLCNETAPIENEQAILDSVGTGTLHPNLKTYFTNGSLNDYTSVQSSAKTISQLLANTTVSFVYNPSQGILRDFLETVAGMLGCQTRTSILLAESIRKEIQENPNVTIFLLGHSQGDINIYNALRSLTNEELQHIERYAFASPSYVPFPSLKADHHYLVENDPIPWMNPYSCAQAYLSPTPNIHLLDSCCDDPVLSHYLLGPAYFPQLQQIGREYLDRYQSSL